MVRSKFSPILFSVLLASSFSSLDLVSASRRSSGMGDDSGHELVRRNKNLARTLKWGAGVFSVAAIAGVALLGYKNPEVSKMIGTKCAAGSLVLGGLGTAGWSWGKSRVLRARGTFDFFRGFKFGDWNPSGADGGILFEGDYSPSHIMNDGTNVINSLIRDLSRNGILTSRLSGRDARRSGRIIDLWFVADFVQRELAELRGKIDIVKGDTDGIEEALLAEWAVVAEEERAFASLDEVPLKDVVTSVNKRIVRDRLVRHKERSWWNILGFSDAPDATLGFKMFDYDCDSVNTYLDLVERYLYVRSISNVVEAARDEFARPFGEGLGQIYLEMPEPVVQKPGVCYRAVGGVISLLERLRNG